MVRFDLDFTLSKEASFDMIIFEHLDKIKGLLEFILFNSTVHPNIKTCFNT